MTSLRFTGLVLFLFALPGCPGTSSPPAGTDSGTGVDAAPDMGDGGGGVDGGGGGTDGGDVDGGGTGTDGGGGGTDSGLVCDGVHPIIGPPRTCEAGRCLCVDMDACFPAEVADACCTAGTITCAPPEPSCNGEHPIVGPPRTCNSGMCFCANPDACFPPASADRCCAVDVVCVP